MLPAQSGGTPQTLAMSRLGDVAAGAPLSDITSALNWAPPDEESSNLSAFYVARDTDHIYVLAAPNSAQLSLFTAVSDDDGKSWTTSTAAWPGCGDLVGGFGVASNGTWVTETVCTGTGTDETYLVTGSATGPWTRGQLLGGEGGGGLCSVGGTVYRVDSITTDSGETYDSTLVRSTDASAWSSVPTPAGFDMSGDLNIGCDPSGYVVRSQKLTSTVSAVSLHGGPLTLPAGGSTGNISLSSGVLFQNNFKTVDCSTDGGASWHQLLNYGAQQVPSTTFAAAADDRGSIFVLAGGVLWANVNQRTLSPNQVADQFYKSQDTGSSLLEYPGAQSNQFDDPTMPLTDPHFSCKQNNGTDSMNCLAGKGETQWAVALVRDPNGVDWGVIYSGPEPGGVD